ncbi:lytic murein transglycosylase B [Herbaspirillum sp. RTI4]|uniref:lytic murein transglycosylase B n=1 Tax=Herbaspirillum sp. RTI4 TaxID=3048640 RepID=UPI002AB5D86C|nr:lytic murein transglycosylase B [Herbaspirillum sp. RTI4]MDY7579890.1 lytic murein transglycosylase B [Herbaspirillum sp. RTI4]MEA9983567.1 lytic murein transglycosylase B [Herbaspirillum sp. RTI4]
MPTFFALRLPRPLFFAGLLVTLSFSAALPPLAQAAAKDKTRLPLTETPPDEFVSFSQWKAVNTFIDDMVAKNGFDKQGLQTVFNDTRHINAALQLVKPAASGKPKNWQAYRARFVEPVRIKAGAAFWSKYEADLNRAEAQYGVPAEIIVAIIGVETVYGRNTGNFRVMDAIATLAFDYPDVSNREARMVFFRGELEQTLLFARDAGIDPFSLLGSYAGAIGWPQFMPGSIRRYAVDFDGDGHIDLRNSPVDAIGSVAHFLQEHGWQRALPTVFPAVMGLANDGSNRWQELTNQGLEAKFSLSDLKLAGVTPGLDAPANLNYGLIDLQNGLEPTEYWLATTNFFAVTFYNRSYFYAMSVIDLAQALRAAHGL